MCQGLLHGFEGMRVKMAQQVCMFVAGFFIGALACACHASLQIRRWNREQYWPTVLALTEELERERNRNR
jgi:hypothetical protein